MHIYLCKLQGYQYSCIKVNMERDSVSSRQFQDSHINQDQAKQSHSPLCIIGRKDFK